MIEITPLVFYSLYYQIYELFIIIFLVIIKIIMLLVLTNSNSKKNVQKRYITLNILIIITILSGIQDIILNWLIFSGCLQLILLNTTTSFPSIKNYFSNLNDG